MEWCNTCGQPLPEKKRQRGFELVKGADIHTILPSRATKGSACYDFYAPHDIVIPPLGKSEPVALGIKAYMPEGWALLLFGRSGLANRDDITLATCVSVIDQDYYGNPGNDGNIGVVLRNSGVKAVKLEKGERICQGMFVQFGLTDDDRATGERAGGFGSTGKK